MGSEVTVLIPAFNEEEYIGNTIYGVRQSGDVKRIIVIDDGSTDNTAKVAAVSGAEVIRLPQNRGKGYALNHGLKGVESRIIAFIDADIGGGSYQLEKLVAPVIEDRVDMTIGVLPPASIRGGFGLVKGLARLLIYYYTGKKLNAGLSGQRVFKKEVLSQICPLPDGFAAEMAINIRTLKKGFRVMEIPVNMTHRETKRDLPGFIHRGRQFLHILKFFVLEARSNRWLF